MPTASKVLVVLILLVALVFVWLSFAVVDGRRQWHDKVKAKGDEAVKVAKEIELMEKGSEEAAREFKTLAEDVLKLGSKGAQDEFQKRLAEGLDVMSAFVIAMDSFLDMRTIEAYQQAVAGLNELQKSPNIEETQLATARAAYDAAEKDLALARENLNTAYSMFLGQGAGQSGVRGLVSKGWAIDSMKETVLRVRQAINAQKAVFATQISDGLKNETQLKDTVASTQSEANTLRLAAENGEKERDERKKEVEQATVDLANAQQTLKEENAKLAKAIAALNELQQQFDSTKARVFKLAKAVREMEIKIDAQRGLKVVVSEDGRVPTGQVQQVDPSDGTLRINQGSRVGFRPGVQLHVYRTSPEAKYLGILEVVSSDSDSAVGRMLPEYRQLPIKTGDFVTPEISKPKPKNQP